jgi:hypothetical protein
MYRALLLLCASTLVVLAADTPTVGSVYDSQLTGLEREFVPLVEAMPADKFGFVPSQGEFKTVRTFAQQAKHVGAVLYMVSAAALGESIPVDTGGENGPEDVKSKDQIVKFVKDAFAYSHKAAKFISAQNQLDMVKSPFGSGQVTRLSLGTILVWHSFDHYGQMAIYLRMNGIIPPASR